MDRILVVDDDDLILTALTRILSAEGYEVLAFNDPHQALAADNFQVVLTDFMMPGLDGVEFLGHVRQKNPKAIRMMLTAAGDFKTASDAVNRGEVFRLLSKPWSITDLTSSVRQALSHYHLVDENRCLQEALFAKNAELVSLNVHLQHMVLERTHGLLDGMIRALDYRDTETQWHSRRVSLFARRVAEEMGIQVPLLDIIEQGSLLHDIGKIGVRDSILLKPGPLTPDEWVEMRKHPEFGHRMLARIPYLHDASLIVLQHQERWDGKGYPAGLKGEDIVVGARIFSVVDAVDAITSDRPYRRGRTLEVAKEELRRCSGTQFDPTVVEAFLAIPELEWSRILQRVAEMEAAEPREPLEQPALAIAR